MEKNLYTIVTKFVSLYTDYTKLPITEKMFPNTDIRTPETCKIYAILYVGIIAYNQLDSPLFNELVLQSIN